MSSSSTVNHTVPSHLRRKPGQRVVVANPTSDPYFQKKYEGQHGTIHAVVNDEKYVWVLLDRTAKETLLPSRHVWPVDSQVNVPDKPKPKVDLRGFAVVLGASPLAPVQDTVYVPWPDIMDHFDPVVFHQVVHGFTEPSGKSDWSRLVSTPYSEADIKWRETLFAMMGEPLQYVGPGSADVCADTPVTVIQEGTIH